eukprot:2677076-Rhodomonas_salina.1
MTPDGERCMFASSTEDNDPEPKDQISVIVPMRSPTVTVTALDARRPSETMHWTADSDSHKLRSEAVSPTRTCRDTSRASKFAESSVKLAPPEGLPFATCDSTSRTES